VFVLICAAAWGERVVFCDGTEEEGRLFYRKGKLYLDTGGRVLELDKHRIASITDRGDTWNEYRRRRDAADENSADDMLELARWCAEHFLMPEAMACYRKVLKVDPDNYEARTALGYVEDNGRWVRWPEAEYRWREARLRCGDVKGYTELALWCLNKGVTDGLKECSFYLLRLDPFHESALKWARRFLERDRFTLDRPPLERAAVLKVGTEPLCAGTLFAVLFGGTDGKGLAGCEAFAPVSGTVDYVQLPWEDLPPGSKRKAGRENFVILRSGSYRVALYGLSKGSCPLEAGRPVKAGEPVGKVGTPAGGNGTLELRVLNADSFSVPVRFSRCLAGRGKAAPKPAENHVPAAGETVAAARGAP